ncbi:DNA repair protein RecN (Recombination protein N) [Desulfomicrobium macestii]|uniref:DNA repair protein RecN n=1 Tax=Desulfomicrobium macestii TaxID=90731 RepID=A0ABR9H0T8_9BACT|nr:AAA family ATPase [Desulfomicrobium macestii]MBE1424308.1 DNA repair protein RecN (Recombination protein N) [Desulfomicrobium macestii]
MLETLRIRNLALIDDVELEFCPGLNVLTGESGAGKSFILRALDFILGERIAADLVRPGREKALVEAVFHLEGEELFLRRELSAKTGRSRLFINDDLGSQERLAELRPRLLMHTSQHGQQRLLSPEHHVEILDAFLADPQILVSQREAREALQAILARKAEVQRRMAGLLERREFLEFQLAEIRKVDPRPGEEDELLRLRDASRRAEKTHALADEAQGLLLGENGLQDALTSLERALAGLGEADEGFGEHAREVGRFRDGMSDMVRDLRALGSDRNADFDAEKVEKRLWELQQLQRKLKRSLDSIVALGEEIEENLSFLDESGLALQRLEKDEVQAAKALGLATAALNSAREAASVDLTAGLKSELVNLGFSEHLRVLVDFRTLTIHAGIDELRPRFLWVPNPGLDAQPLDRIASGGELSRFLLAVVSLRARAQLPALLFDEVDSGIGGQTLIKVAERIRLLSARQQVILITHWPQLARLADEHFAIRKEVHDGVTYTLCASLSPAERQAELARMVGEVPPVTHDPGQESGNFI